MDLEATDPRLLALVAGLVTWALTALGAAAVLLTRQVGRSMLDGMLGFAAGVMISASMWSLLVPALAMAEHGPLPHWIPATAGFLLGGAALWGLDRVLPHVHLDVGARAEGPATAMRRTTLLVLALTLHNLPEGIAVGVGFGALGVDSPGATLAGAIALTTGIGIQDVPEGLALAYALRRDGMSAWRSFTWGQLSGAVEPVGAVLGAIAVTFATSMLPWALGFAAGAMMFVVIEELIPEAQASGETNVPTIGAMLGFAVMMVLDTALS